MTAPVFGRDCACVEHRCAHVRRDAGMARVEGAEHSAWTAEALRWVYRLPTGTEFTAEDLCAAVGRPERPNSVGARLSALARSGLIVEAGYVQAERSERHASRMLRWARS